MINIKKLYEHFRSLIIWLGLTELAWISYWLLFSGYSSIAYIRTVIFWVAVLLIWMVVASALGLRGVYLRNTHYFSNLIGFVSVLVFTALVFVFMPSAWEGLKLAANNISNTQLTAIHVLRLLAVGTIIKYMQREIPLHFLILGSLPDFFFAVSAVIVTTMTVNGTVDSGFLVIWHIVGASVFLGAGLSMFFSMPSLVRITKAKPDTTIVFQFPMILAPNYTVPLFVVAHGIALVKLLAI